MGSRANRLGGRRHVERGCRAMQPPTAVRPVRVPLQQVPPDQAGKPSVPFVGAGGLFCARASFRALAGVEAPAASVRPLSMYISVLPSSWSQARPKPRDNDVSDTPKDEYALLYAPQILHV